MRRVFLGSFALAVLFTDPCCVDTEEACSDPPEAPLILPVAATATSVSISPEDFERWSEWTARMEWWAHECGQGD